MTRTQRALPLGLLAVLIGLSLVIALEITSAGQGDTPYPAAARQSAAERSSRTPAPQAPDQTDTWLKQILAAPLFSPDRRPVEVGVRGLPRLSGIVVTGSQRLAIFAAPSSGRRIVAEAGARIGAYTVQTIADDGVTVVGPEGTSVIRPVFDAARQITPAPRPVAPAPARPAAK